MTASGKFPFLEAFLLACEADRHEGEREEAADWSPAAHGARRPKDRDVVEVDCRIAVVEPGDTSGLKHILLHVELTEVLASDPDVDADVQRHLASHDYVLVAIQYGGHDSGIPGSIPGLVEGADIRVRGAWITAEQARPEGGEKLSVLHFTHAPIGFVMVGGTVYR